MLCEWDYRNKGKIAIQYGDMPEDMPTFVALSQKLDIKLSAEGRAKKFADGTCLYCGDCNHWAAECTERNTSQTLKAARAEVVEVQTWGGSNELGKIVVN